ncbi:MAG: DUF4097 domain-containing protein [Lachnospiraceae bacterium]|nr:DUF4097 domain-containing protein [Lachnospiraceae bacterium]
MKPTSIIMLVFSIVLIVFGVFVCSTASGMAEKQGIDLFFQSTDEDGNLITTFKVENGIKKISLELVGTDVNIIGGAEETKIELVNFKINTFTHNQTEDTISISNDTDILSLLNLNGKGEQFLGLRHYRNLKNLKSGKASVNVYVSDFSTLESFEISAGKGDIFATGVSVAADYDISISNGKIEFSNCRNAKKVEFSIDEKGDASVRGSSFAELTVGIGEGSFQLNSTARASATSYALKTEEGTITVNSENLGTAYNLTSPAAETSVTVNLVKGSAVIVDIQN